MKYCDVPIPKPPYIKGKGFLNDCCDVAINGIPKYADSRFDPKVIGTLAWENFWKGELYKIHNGVDAGGLKIPGRYYYYLNYGYMATVGGVMPPDMVDLHLELAYLLDYCIENGINILIPKARRLGITEALHKMAVDYGCRFSIFKKGVVSDKYVAGVAAGDKKYVDGFITKWRYADSMMPPELSIKTNTDNDDEIIFGYQQKNELGAWEDKGTFNTILARTAHSKSNIFKGEYLNICISEEIGEHENWFDFYADTKDCLNKGKTQFGIMIGLGTGGNIKKGSKDFKKLSEKAEYYNFIEFVPTGDRFYYYGGASDEKQELPKHSKLLQQYKPYQLIGVEDRELATERILARRVELYKAGDMEEYYKELQNHPLNKMEIFRNTVANNFNMEKLNIQQHAIDSDPYKKYSRYKLEWHKDRDGMIVTPWKVSAIPATEHDDDSVCVYIIDGEHPRLKTHKNLYVAGIDSYNIDTSKTSKSLGAMCVLIRENSIINAYRKAPVAIIRTRPPRKEKFYEMCLQMAVYYNMVGNVLGDIRSDGILEYWKTRGGEKYLAGRPAKFEKADSEVGTDYWFSINKSTKPLMVGVMQQNIEDYVDQMWFPHLIDELQNYDEVEIGSDNDLADAWAIALVQDLCADLKPKDITISEDNEWDMPEWGTDSNGNVIMKNERSHSDNPELDDHGLFG